MIFFAYFDILPLALARDFYVYLKYFQRMGQLQANEAGIESAYSPFRGRRSSRWYT